MSYLTVIETPHYLAKAEKLLTHAQMQEITMLLAANPDLGDMMAGTGGVRKFRFALHGSRGKSGGARVLHFAATGRGKVFLLDIFAKNEKANLSTAEKQILQRFTRMLREENDE